MSDAASVDACRRRSRLMSIIGAVVVFAIIWLLFGWGFWLGLILGVIAYFALSWFLGRACDDASGAADAAQAHPAAAPVAPTPSLGTAQGGTEDATEASVAEAVAPASDQEVTGGTAKTAETSESAAQPAAATAGHWSSSVSAASGKASPNRGQTGLKSTATLSEEETLRDGVGAWKYTAASAPAAAQPTASAPAADVADAAPAPTGDAPETLSGARDGGADDLTRIKGVGPGLEKTLNELGFYHFDQIAAWTDQDIAWVDSRLKFKGRIVRDNWVDQAKAFKAGA